jgi:hypothetical protein
MVEGMPRSLFSLTSIVLSVTDDADAIHRESMANIYGKDPGKSEIESRYFNAAFNISTGNW